MSITETSAEQKIFQTCNSTSAVGGAFYESTADPTNLAYIMANRRIVTYGMNQNRGNRLSTPNKASETEQILEDTIIMDALRRSDSQFVEGKAKPLRKLIADLGFEEDELLY
jgi:hypothetical protein